ncbi:MAG: PLDc N-terminal domain-containing protein [Cellulomonadaceae bacterium]
MKFLLALLVVAVTVYAVVDCINATDEDRRGLPRGLWLILIILLPIFGPVAWFLISSAQRRARLSSGGGPLGGYSAPGAASRGTGRRPASGPVAPDDDPDFLWRLEQERRRAARAESNDPDAAAGDEAHDVADDAVDDEDRAPEDEPPSDPRA